MSPKFRLAILAFWAVTALSGAPKIIALNIDGIVHPVTVEIV